MGSNIAYIDFKNVHLPTFAVVIQSVFLFSSWQIIGPLEEAEVFNQDDFLLLESIILKTSGERIKSKVQNFGIEEDRYFQAPLRRSLQMNFSCRANTSFFSGPATLWWRWTLCSRLSLKEKPVWSMALQMTATGTAVYKSDEQDFFIELRGLKS